MCLLYLCSSAQFDSQAWHANNSRPPHHPPPRHTCPSSTTNTAWRRRPCLGLPPHHHHHHQQWTIAATNPRTRPTTATLLRPRCLPSVLPSVFCASVFCAFLLLASLSSAASAAACAAASASAAAASFAGGGAIFGRRWPKRERTTANATPAHGGQTTFLFWPRPPVLAAV